MTEPDTASPSAPHAVSNPDELRHTLTVEHVGILLTRAGVPRSRRQIIRYCQTGLLDAVKVPGPTGDQWYISPASLPKAIGDLKQWEAQRERQGVPQSDMSNPVHPMSAHDQPEKAVYVNSDAGGARAPGPDTSNSEHGTNTDTTELVVPGHSETRPVAASYVAQLEKRIEEKDDFIGLLKGQLTAKDEQIGELSTRYRETHTLLGAMQRMFAPLLGQTDPYQPSADHRETRVDNSPQAGN
jgi:hypothetical protein